MVYEPSIRVPLVMRGPGVPSGCVCRRSSRTSTSPRRSSSWPARRLVSRRTGRSFWPLFRDPGQEWDATFCSSAAREGGTSATASIRPPHAAVPVRRARDGRARAVRPERRPLRAAQQLRQTRLQTDRGGAGGRASFGSVNAWPSSAASGLRSVLDRVPGRVRVVARWRPGSRRRRAPTWSTSAIVGTTAVRAASTVEPPSGRLAAWRGAGSREASCPRRAGRRAAGHDRPSQPMPLADLVAELAQRPARLGLDVGDLLGRQVAAIPTEPPAGPIERPADVIDGHLEQRRQLVCRGLRLQADASYRTSCTGGSERAARCDVAAPRPGCASVRRPRRTPLRGPARPRTAGVRPVGAARVVEARPPPGREPAELEQRADDVAGRRGRGGRSSRAGRRAGVRGR